MFCAFVGMNNKQYEMHGMYTKIWQIIIYYWL